MANNWKIKMLTKKLNRIQKKIWAKNLMEFRKLPKKFGGKNYFTKTKISPKRNKNVD